MPKGLSPRARGMIMSDTKDAYADVERRSTMGKERRRVEEDRRKDIVAKSSKLTSKVPVKGFIKRRTSGDIAKGNLKAAQGLLGLGSGKVEAAESPPRPSKNVIKREPGDLRGSRYNAEVFAEDAKRSRALKPKNKHILPVGDRSYEPPRPKPRPKKRDS